MNIGTPVTQRGWTTDVLCHSFVAFHFSQQHG